MAFNYGFHARHAAVGKFNGIFLKILCNLLVGGEHLVITVKNSLPMLVFTLWSNGGLYQITFLFLDLLLSVCVGLGT